jgi:hypothetical protein
MPAYLQNREASIPTRLGDEPTIVSCPTPRDCADVIAEEVQGPSGTAGHKRLSVRFSEGLSLPTPPDEY